jgi:hypothetical protein
MAKFGFTAAQELGTTPEVARAYAEGRAASHAAAAISTNPHIANTPEWVAWRNGHVTYAAAGANTVYDNCAQPAKYDNPTAAIANVAADITGATKSATPSAPGLPVRINWGDGFYNENPAASVAAINHKYAASGTYKFNLNIIGRVFDAKDVVVTIV